MFNEEKKMKNFMAKKEQIHTLSPVEESECLTYLQEHTDEEEKSMVYLTTKYACTRQALMGLLLKHTIERFSLC